jgi:N-acetyl-anhydromuramyl-L-alanine amidase AmpD
MIVIHHIGSNKGKLYRVNGTVTWFTNEEVHRNKKTGKIENKVSAHYIIPRSPYKEHDIIHLVNHNDIAYHAGYSQWAVDGKDRKYINNYSIGIELEGDGNLVEYTDFQYDTLISLTKELMNLHNIPEDNIVGHEDISPGRKVDPGKFFDWKRLRSGINPPALVMPEVVITPADEPDEDPGLPAMESGENLTGGPTGIVSLIMKIIQKITN